MKTYIFLTTEGTTFSPNRKNIGNLQVIGIVKDVKNEDEALKRLLMENEWIFDGEYNVAAFISYQIL
jgi:hypothetical protein